MTDLLILQHVGISHQPLELSSLQTIPQITTTILSAPTQSCFHLASRLLLCLMTLMWEWSEQNFSQQFANPCSQNLQVEFHPSCDWDFLEVRNGATSSGPLVSKLCGQGVIPAPLTSSSNYMFLRFSSDFLITARGWQISFMEPQFTTVGVTTTISTTTPTPSKKELFIKGSLAHKFTLRFLNLQSPQLQPPPPGPLEVRSHAYRAQFWVMITWLTY